VTSAIFLTGVTGFLGRRVARESLAAGRPVYGLARSGSVLPPELRDVRIVPGDLRRPGLGISQEDLSRLEADVTDVIHAGALRLPQDDATAEDVNVGGTVRTSEVSRRLPRLKRFVHVGSISVAGTYPGRFYEDWLDVGQSFPNSYSRTKYRAEEHVRQRVDLPSVVVRPGSIVGDSQTGESDPSSSALDKVIHAAWKLRKLPRVVPLPRPFPRERLMPAAPIDYVAKATLALARAPAPRAMTYCLSDPTPARLSTVIDRIADMMGSPRFRVPMPLEAIRTATKLPGIKQALAAVRFPIESLAYMECKFDFDTHNAIQALSPLGIRCPSLLSYLETLVDAFVARVSRAAA
jgi:nucleoside-diphosphate-sugar epimerase